jgi:putative Mg2+ transporter-C (MgtC) family protein
MLMNMPLHVTWQDILVRLVLTMIAGTVIGLNRGVRGHAAGLRTTILVGLAAAVSMVQANVLLSVGGKEADSFGVMDLMRLPLGILTGVGFIGGGAILKQGASIKGITTAATLWIMTTIGLCLGGGQIGLGVIATAFGIITLWAMEWIDVRIPREQAAMLVIEAALAGSISDLNDLIRSLGYRARFRRQSQSVNPEQTEISFEIRWKQPEADDPTLNFLKVIGQRYRVKSFEMVSEAHY